VLIAKKWQELTGVLCDRRMPIAVKGKVYRTMIRPVLIYGSEAWTLRRREEERLERTEMRKSCPEGQEKEWWHPSHHWSSMHHGQGTRGQAEMVWAYTTERRWLCQTNPRGRRSWTTKSRKTEKEMDRRRQVQRGGLVAHGGGHGESCRMEMQNPCGWPLTRGIHSLKEIEVCW